METIELQVSGMTCGSCVGRVREALSRLPGVQQVEVLLAQGLALARVDQAGRLPDLLDALDAAGYPARPREVTPAETPPAPRAGGCGGGGCCCH